MKNQFEDIDLELKDLKPNVRAKALEILKDRQDQLKTNRNLAIKKAIEEAENWFMDSEG
ncbi:hypothetical protein [Pedobacter cryotolerans]|uniref:hypothetical protein n=1 Tax=Pedobacter cryotolerans TaxID=2571270 RepID=UPI00145ECD91|nr:hypothetical protein [Pedobacter cryotolerans]